MIFAECATKQRKKQMQKESRTKVVTAKNAGFCFGVRRAVDTVNELRSKTDKTIYTIGELIHNSVFVRRLEKQNILVVEEENLPMLEKDKDNIILVVRAHGIKKEIIEYLDEKGFTYVNATCPYVERIHEIVDKNTHDASLCVVMGDKKHPEAVGTISYAHCDAVVCSDEDELRQNLNDKLTSFEECFVLTSQTTYNNEKYVNCQKVAKKLYTNAKIFDTICSVTEKRQNEVVQLSKECDVMLVVGGKKSSNTKKLGEISSEYCLETFLIETADELDKEKISALCKKKLLQPNTVFTVGITAGASTPDDILEEVKVRASEIIITASGETTT